MLARRWRRPVAALRPGAGAADIGARLAPMLLVAGSILLVAVLGLDRLGVRTIGRCRPACRT
jgi:SulP family sulfate permease